MVHQYYWLQNYKNAINVLSLVIIKRTLSIHSKPQEIYSTLKNLNNINIEMSNLRNPRIYSHYTNKHINIMYEWKHSSHKCSKD